MSFPRIQFRRILECYDQGYLNRKQPSNAARIHEQGGTRAVKIQARRATADHG